MGIAATVNKTCGQGREEIIPKIQTECSKLVFTVN